MKFVYKGVRYKGTLDKDKNTVNIEDNKISIEDITVFELTTEEMLDFLTSTATVKETPKVQNYKKKEKVEKEEEKTEIE